MDKFKKYYGSLCFSEEFDKKVFDYIISHPNITAKKLADIRMEHKKSYISTTEWKIASPHLAKRYIQIVKSEIKTKT